MNRRLMFLPGVACIAAAAPLATSPAMGQMSSISYSCGGAAPTVVVDNGALDLDPAVGSIVHQFDCTVAVGIMRWRATGELRGTLDWPVAATTSLTGLTIQNLEGNVAAQVFEFQHEWLPPLGPPLIGTWGSLEGVFDSVTSPGWVNGASLTWATSVRQSPVWHPVMGGFAAGVGAAPIPFSDEGGPLVLAHPDAHKVFLMFYLDSPGDAILMGAGDGIFIEKGPPVVVCYADCNLDGLLTVADFGCFQTKFVLGNPYADCTGDGLFTVADFGCFQTKFVLGCP